MPYLHVLSFVSTIFLGKMGSASLDIIDLAFYCLSANSMYLFFTCSLTSFILLYLVSTYRFIARCIFWIGAISYFYSILFSTSSYFCSSWNVYSSICCSYYWVPNDLLIILSSKSTIWDYISYYKTLFLYTAAFNWFSIAFRIFCFSLLSSILDFSSCSSSKCVMTNLMHSICAKYGYISNPT